MSACVSCRGASCTSRPKRSAPAPAGWFYIVERRGSENIDHVGEYFEVVRPRRLVFTLFAEKYSLQFERVTVVLEPLGSGCNAAAGWRCSIGLPRCSARPAATRPCATPGPPAD